jgi:adenine-specific DNA-methyltransferase
MSEQPAKVDLVTPDLAAEKRSAFEDLFPGVLADDVLDAGRLGELLDTEVTAPADGRERFGLMWAGKQDAIRSLLTPSRGTLVPELEKSIDFDTAQNVFIEGDNLEVLKLLQKAYNDKVKLIFIDPPYNTGSDFVYNDDFSDGLRGYLEYSRQIDEEGNRLSTTTEVTGRLHSRWLTMMYPRLVLARNLLRQDGLFATCIDDKEAHNLRALLDEVFGAENFVTTIAWQSRTSVQNDTDISVSHEYLVLYARNRRQTDRRLKEQNKATWYSLPSFAAFPKPADPDRYSNPDNDPRGPWKGDPFDAPNVRPNLTYMIVNPNTGEEIWPPPGRCWRTGEDEFNRLASDGRISWGKTGAGKPKLKVFYEEKRDLGEVEITWWDGSSAGTATSGTKELQELFGGRAPFDTPKPTALIRRLLALATRGNDLVLDFFAGSGSTMHAVALQNLEDGGSRRSISVNIPEPTRDGSAAAELGFQFVSDITLARIRKVLEKVESAREDGLRVLALRRSNFRVSEDDMHDLFDLGESTLIDGEPDMNAIASEVLLKEGVPLDARWEHHAASDEAVVVADGVAVVLSLEITHDLVNEVLALSPRVVVFLEDGFAGRDAVKANAFTNARNLGIAMKTV